MLMPVPMRQVTQGTRQLRLVNGRIMLQSLTWFELPDGEGAQSRVDWRLTGCSSQEVKLHFPEPALPTACFLANRHADFTHGVARIVETSGTLFNAKHSILGFHSLVGAWTCFEPPAKR
jgi:hypothetical protein